MSNFETEIRKTDSYGSFSETVYYENLSETEIILLSPHGGQVEPNTEQISQLLRQTITNSEDIKTRAGVWYTTGIVNGSFNDAFGRWHTTDDTHSVEDFPLYMQLNESEYEIVFGIHVMSKEGIIIGGCADTQTQQSLQNTLQEYFESHPVTVAENNSPLAGRNPNNFTNTLTSNNAIHLELSRRIAMENPEKFVEATSEWIHQETTL